MKREDSNPHIGSSLDDILIADGTINKITKKAKKKAKKYIAAAIKKGVWEKEGWK